MSPSIFVLNNIIKLCVQMEVDLMFLTRRPFNSAFLFLKKIYWGMFDLQCCTRHILAWKIQWTQAPGRLESMGSQRVEHDWAISLTHSSGISALLYQCNIVVSMLYQQNESVIHIHISTPLFFKVLFPYRLLQRMEWSSFCYRVGLQ